MTDPQDQEVRELTGFEINLIDDLYNAGNVGRAITPEQHKVCMGVIEEGLAKELDGKLYLTGAGIEQAKQLERLEKEPVAGGDLQADHVDEMLRALDSENLREEILRHITIPVVLDDDLRALVREGIEMSCGIGAVLREMEGQSGDDFRLGRAQAAQLALLLHRLCDRVMGGRPEGG